ncbi:MAG: hypothetical protein BZY82_01705 [SAR202 cluster bacterium Io17-Chloro-G3]|nr:MAG: hypothetical protein BZY82_01705 [SAR202 cluster bacterium Io17-Chloro-G3]
MKRSITFTIIALLVLVATIGCGSGRTKAPDINLFDAIGEENVSAVKQHMDAGTNPDILFIPPGYPWAGASPLHLAVVVGNKEIVGLLISNGAEVDIRAKDQPGGTPLQWLAFFGKKDMAEILVNSGAEVNAKDNNGCTALCAANVPNPFTKDTDVEFQKARTAIQDFLKRRGGKL